MSARSNPLLKCDPQNFSKDKERLMNKVVLQSRSIAAGLMFHLTRRLNSKRVKERERDFYHTSYNYGKGSEMIDEY